MNGFLESHSDPCGIQMLLFVPMYVCYCSYQCVEVLTEDTSQARRPKPRGTGIWEQSPKLERQNRHVLHAIKAATDGATSFYSFELFSGSVIGPARVLQATRVRLRLWVYFDTGSVGEFFIPLDLWPGPLVRREQRMLQRTGSAESTSQRETCWASIFVAIGGLVTQHALSPECKVERYV